MKRLKRFTAFSVVLVMIFALAGCGNSADYIAMMILFAFLGYLIVMGLSAIGNRK